MNSIPSILFIDDEPYILKSLQRLFEDENYEILTANNGEEGLKILESRPVTLVISDYRMPEIDGVQFFLKAAELNPDAIRIMLTGYADIEVIVSAINQGQVFRFITKPWNEEEFKLMVKDCIQHHELRMENRRLNELTFRQNEELKILNTNLQSKIDAATKEIQGKNVKLELLYKALDQSFFETIKLILKVIETHNNKLGEHSKKVTHLAESIGKDMGLSQQELRNVQIAGLLHDLGKINLPLEILFKNESLLSPEQRQALRQHPLTGNMYLASIERLKPVSEIILHHHENLDGSGYPFGKKEEEIPLEAKIISVADAYANAVSGLIHGSAPLMPHEAFQQIKVQAGTKFDPKILDHLEQVLKKN
ncbi:MAG: response regulator [Candidatus Aureabacteria bacterium]|nr:response regulator [Candidatus Auribacterota bacterium]